MLNDLKWSKVQNRQLLMRALD